MLDTSFLNDHKFLLALNKSRFTVQRKSEYAKPVENYGIGGIIVQRRTENGRIASL